MRRKTVEVPIIVRFHDHRRRFRKRDAARTRTVSEIGARENAPATGLAGGSAFQIT